MNELTTQTRITALSMALQKALSKAATEVPSTADEIVVDAKTFYQFLKKEDNPQ